MTNRMRKRGRIQGDSPCACQPAWTPEIAPKGLKPYGPLWQRAFVGASLGFQPALPDISAIPENMRRHGVLYIAGRKLMCGHGAQPARLFRTRARRHSATSQPPAKGLGAGYQPFRRRHGRAKVASVIETRAAVSLLERAPIICFARPSPPPARWLCRGS